VIKEERKLIFLGPGPTQVPVYDFTSLAGGDADATGFEAEAFSPELGWMPSLVLMAKNTYVWMDQLSRKYGRLIDRLDQIPDEELDQLSRWGFTGLWLIGVWERSPASQRIKVLCGNPDAVPSAYSLYDYNIAADLGGEAAYQDLKDRAWARGIRMASDMVPNHVGIVSRWVIEHPDWFVWREDNPYPWYTYGGPDLSNDDRVAIHIEDHYYDRTDAAVVFRRTDRHTGHQRYVYHGNDGTSMPWNDTAQLNYLNPELREAVIQTILHVARQFPVIRFDAAMTLAKRHFQRLWFPEPGTGGAIPTRAEVGLSRDEFNAIMPHEFWREVVDRVAAEAPNTLLLAEAFWLLEGYFVRTLGMHRVYNSAFMVMLRDEDNAKYRQVMKNTLEFDPEVLRRFVNFMNNPDERTAVDQFGSGDKYFGVCTLLVTMPGLPMIGHGQVEGYAEKYGMEFRRPYWDETPDRALVERHEREIFPLMRMRPLFAGVENFLLYDAFTPDGSVNEDVFAYSNRLDDQRGLIVYNNRFAEARGWLKTSAAFAQRTGHGDEKAQVQRTLAEGLALEAGDDWYSVFRDQVGGLEYIRSNGQLRSEGLYFELGAYRRLVLTGFRQVQDTNGQYSQLTSYLNGRGVPNVDEAMREIRLQPIQRPFTRLVEPELLRRLLDVRASIGGEIAPELLSEVQTRLSDFLNEACRFDGSGGELDPILQRVSERLSVLSSLLSQARSVQEERVGLADEAPEAPATTEAEALAAGDVAVPSPLPTNGHNNGTAAKAPGLAAASETPGSLDLVSVARQLSLERPEVPAALLVWALTRPLGELIDSAQVTETNRALFDEWLLGSTAERALGGLGLDDGVAMVAVALARVLLAHERALAPAEARGPRRVLESLLSDGDVRDFLGINRYRDVLWFSQERFDALVAGLQGTASVLLTSDVMQKPATGTPSATSTAPTPSPNGAPTVASTMALARALRDAEEASAFQVERLLRLLPITPVR
jgi:glycosidase